MECHKASKYRETVGFGRVSVVLGNNGIPRMEKII